MKLDTRKISLFLANQCKCPTDLRATGMSPTTISKAVKGEKVSYKTAGKLASALGVSVEDILLEV